MSATAVTDRPGRCRCLPYGMDFDLLREATAGCAELGLELDVDAQWAIHACDQWTLGVVISRTGLHDVLHPVPAKLTARPARRRLAGRSPITSGLAARPSGELCRLGPAARRSTA